MLKELCYKRGHSAVAKLLCFRDVIVAGVKFEMVFLQKDKNIF